MKMHDFLYQSIWDLYLKWQLLYFFLALLQTSHETFSDFISLQVNWMLIDLLRLFLLNKDMPLNWMLNKILVWGGLFP